MAPRTLGVRLQRLAAVVLGGLLLFVLGGCGGSSSTSSTDALTAEAVTTTATDLTGANGDGLTASGTGPTITTQPSPVTARIGASASFTVVASGTNLKYQWYKSGALITGATSDKYTISSVATTDLGAYRVLVSNGTGHTPSNSVKLRVVTALGVWGLYEQSGGTTALTAPTLTATAANQSAVWVTDGGVLTITDPLFTTSGNTSSQENSSFYGLNAGVLASAGTISVTGGKIRTRGSGANGAFAVGSGSTVTLSGVTINATADGGHGVMATQGGKVNLTNVIINTAGKNSAALATDRGGGTITATGGKFVTSGADSPGLYSTGALNVTGAQVVAKGAEAAVIEGSNAISLQNSTRWTRRQKRPSSNSGRMTSTATYA